MPAREGAPRGPGLPARWVHRAGPVETGSPAAHSGRFATGGLAERVPGAVGRRVISWAGQAGRASLFLFATLRRVGQRPWRIRVLIEHMHFIGNRSFGIVALTSAFTGMVLALQGYHALVRFGSEGFLGPLVALSLIRELGPVLAALMITARAGSAIAATIATMRISEQVDALLVMAVDPLHYLVVPRFLAAVIVVPMLAAAFSLIGIGAAYLLATAVLGVDGGTFVANLRASVTWSDVSGGVWKSVVFGLFIAWICCFQGYQARGGAMGVGSATTTAVVAVSVLVLVSDYVMTALLW